MALDKSNIKVLNYNRSFISVPCKDRNVGIDGSNNGVEPNFDFFTMQELDYINAHCPLVFRTGALEFEDEYRAEIYTALRIPDWRERCIFERDIDDMIMNPTRETMKKIVGIKDVQTIERVRGHMLDLIYSGAGVGTNLQKAVDQRFNELSNGIMNTRIEVEEHKAPVYAVSQDVEDLKAQLAAMQALLASQAASIQEAANAKIKENTDDKVEEVDENKVKESAEKSNKAASTNSNRSTSSRTTKSPEKPTADTTKEKKPVGRPKSK